MSNVGFGRLLEQDGSTRKGYIDLDKLATINPVVSNALLIVQIQIASMNANCTGLSQLQVDNWAMPIVGPSKMPFQYVGHGFMNTSEVQQLLETISLPLKTYMEVVMPPLGTAQTPSVVMTSPSQPGYPHVFEHVDKMQVQHVGEEVLES